MSMTLSGMCRSPMHKTKTIVYGCVYIKV
jgi:hypothetical protein